MSAPDSSSMKKCVQDMKAHNVKLLVRCCENTYNEADLTSQGIEVMELIFPDGQLPSKADMQRWSKVVEEFVQKHSQTETSNQSPVEESKEVEKKSIVRGQRVKETTRSKNPRIGVHCVAGLGRAPLLVAIALVNAGCQQFDAIELIRKNRKGALNVIQANFIIEYKPNEKQVCQIF